MDFLPSNSLVKDINFNNRLKSVPARGKKVIENIYDLHNLIDKCVKKLTNSYYKESYLDIHIWMRCMSDMVEIVKEDQVRRLFA